MALKNNNLSNFSCFTYAIQYITSSPHVGANDTHVIPNQILLGHITNKISACKNVYTGDQIKVQLSFPTRKYLNTLKDKLTIQGSKM